MPQRAAYQVVFLFFSPKSKVGQGGAPTQPLLRPEPLAPPSPSPTGRGNRPQPRGIGDPPSNLTRKRARGDDSSGFASHRSRSLRPAVPFGHGDNSSSHRPKQASRSKGAHTQTPCNGGAGSVSAARALELQQRKSLRIHRHEPEPKPPRPPSPSSTQESRRFKILFAFNTPEEKLWLTSAESS